MTKETNGRGSGTDFAGQKAVISGATRGIGRAITLALLDRGATVIGLYGGNEEAAARLREERSDDGGRLRLHRCDVADYQAVASLFAAMEKEFDTIDILVSNAGIRRDGVLAMMAEEDWRRVIEVNLTGGYHLAKFAVQLMLKKRYGRILFITSPMAHMGFAGQANYAASKAGQIGMMKSLSRETAKRGITVNCVSPGFIATDLLDGIPEDKLKEYRNMVPMRRFGAPEEVADLVLYLAGRSAAYITGSVFEITGGI